MKRTFSFIVVCCAFSLALGFTACGNPDSGEDREGTSGAAGTSEPTGTEAASTVQARTDFPADCIDIDGGITLVAVRTLSGPDLTALLEKQGYEWKSFGWKNAGNGDFFRVSTVDDDTVMKDDFRAAAGEGELAKGYVQFATHARTINTADDMVAIRDVFAKGFTVEDSWFVGNNTFFYNVLKDESGARYILMINASEEDEAYVEFESDAYLNATGFGGVDGLIELWKS